MHSAACGIFAVTHGKNDGGSPSNDIATSVNSRFVCPLSFRFHFNVSPLINFQVRSGFGEKRIFGVPHAMTTASTSTVKLEPPMGMDRLLPSVLNFVISGEPLQMADGHWRSCFSWGHTLPQMAGRELACYNIPKVLPNLDKPEPKNCHEDTKTQRDVIANLLQKGGPFEKGDLKRCFFANIQISDVLRFSLRLCVFVAKKKKI